ncbi:formate/nitrite transporter family protein [Sulfitobacter guttiformis]|uniref:Formate/nitrite transporter FocA (FNT family) n=1 Tax=Sulfitobacter guttiformis TaxID=74349 RepID=A0A420DRL1_9RHOB|nr:formate/nitrite transporter family protein [Sulfitobacter guttiformis]KIN74165.1 Transporter, formate/nitrite family [Sulfitobacter guttiformis KCTC 32187]RKE96779.1 formate/nitrite transporter FocA (FNT family) [Sulfitobacter guttiformis]
MTARATRQEQTKKETEEQSVEEAAALSPRMIYEVIRRDGEEELERTKRSLFLSGIAAGILISLSVLGEAVLRTYLPDSPHRFLIENLGYSLGFLAVIMGRMQLFTENTITTVLPTMHLRTLDALWCMLRLWSIVLGANVIGAFAAAALFVFTPAVSSEVMPAIVSLSEHATGMSAAQGFWRAIPAGVIVALIVWMLPQASQAAFFLILTFTWLIAAGDFTHIVAGSVEMAVLVLRGDLGGSDAVFGFFIPVLSGNVIGGTVIFTLLAYGQVRDDVEAKAES